MVGEGGGFGRHGHPQRGQVTGPIQGRAVFAIVSGWGGGGGGAVAAATPSSRHMCRLLVSRRPATTHRFVRVRGGEGEWGGGGARRGHGTITKVIGPFFVSGDRGGREIGGECRRSARGMAVRRRAQVRWGIVGGGDGGWGWSGEGRGWGLRRRLSRRGAEGGGGGRHHAGGGGGGSRSQAGSITTTGDSVGDEEGGGSSFDVSDGDREGGGWRAGVRGKSCTASRSQFEGVGGTGGGGGVGEYRQGRCGVGTRAELLYT